MKAQVEYGVTKNVGNYESVRISIRLEDEIINSEKETIEKLYKRAKKYVLNKASKEMNIENVVEL